MPFTPTPAKSKRSESSGCETPRCPKRFGGSMESTMLEPATQPPGAALVSIVVLTFNRREEVLRTLSALAALPEQAPIVVVDNASTDGTAEAIVAHFPQVRIVQLPANVGA